MDAKKPNKCYMCGDCCRDFEIDLRDEDLKDPDFVRFVELHGCKVNKEKGDLKIPLTCKMLTKDKKCRIYGERPSICRNWIPGEDCKK